MYSIYDKESAILQVQGFLRAIGDKDIFVAPSGVYDENTRLSVVSFQRENQLEPSGVVDLITFRLLYDQFIRHKENQRVMESNAHILDFPVLPGGRARGMAHINRMLSLLMNYYGHIHNLQETSNYYTAETANAVRIMRKIYALEPLELIDTELYQMLTLDTGEIEKSTLSESFE